MEFLDIQTEFALTQKCSMAIIGESNFAQKIISHMCCGFPLHQRGYLPHRCVCPPFVKIHHRGFECEHGNTLACRKRPGSIALKSRDDPSSLIKLNYSFAFMTNVDISLVTDGFKETYSQGMDSSLLMPIESSFILRAFNQTCSDYEQSPPRRFFCSD